MSLTRTGPPTLPVMPRRPAAAGTAAGTPWYPRGREAALLAWLLNFARLTVLVGEPGSGKTSLLERELPSLLRQRNDDDGLPPRVFVTFGDWRADPLPRLLAAVHAAAGLSPLRRAAPAQRLAEQLEALLRRRPIRLRLVLDGFDTVLGRAHRHAEAMDTIEQLVEVVNHPGLPVHLLIVTRDEGEQAFEPLRTAVPGFDALCLHLPPLPDLDVCAAQQGQGVRAEAAVSPSVETTPRELRRVSLADLPDVAPEAHAGNAAGAPPGDAGMSTAAVYASIESVLARTAVPPAAPMAFGLSRRSTSTPVSPPPASVRADPASEPGPSPVPAPMPQPQPQPTAVDAAPRPAAAVDPAAEPAPRVTAPPTRPDAPAAPPPARRWLRVAATAAAMALLVAFGWSLHGGLGGEPAAMTQSTAPDAGTPVLAAHSPSLPDEPLPFGPPGAGSMAPPLWPGAVAATPMEPVASAPSTLPVATAVPLHLARDEAGPSRLAVELAERVAPRAGLRLDPRPDGGRPAPGAGPQLAILGYDTLQAARRSGRGSDAAPAWQIVTPLHIEPIVVVARATGPLQHLHQLQGRHLNLGPGGGRRAEAGRAVYERLFGTPPEAAGVDSAPLDEALPRLLAGRGVDAIVLVGTRSIDWLRRLPADTAGQLRPLSLDPDAPASRRVLQTFLPARVAGTPSLAVMDFLVASGFGDADDRLTRLAQALCESLPALQRDGDAAWRAVRPGLQLPTGWPVARAAEAGFRDCAAAAVAAVPRPALR